MDSFKNNNGLMFALLTLLLMSLTCHLKTLWKNITKRQTNSEKFQLVDPVYAQNDIEKYNRINYLNLDKCVGLPCSTLRDEDHPDIPCDVYKKCFQTVEADTPYKLSDEDQMILYLTAYAEAGLESMGRSRRRNNEN
jgi:hypothetical protein